MVYLQGTIPEEMKAHILKKLSDTPIINVIAKRIIKKNGKSIEPNGYNDLFDETIKKIKESIKGAMQKLMTQSYRNYIKNVISTQKINILSWEESYKKAKEYLKTFSLKEKISLMYGNTINPTRGCVGQIFPIKTLLRI